MIGRIYIIRSKQIDKVYVGSTFETLNERFRLHKLKQDCTSVEILKYPDATIELLECYECENDEELRKREGYYIRQHDCVNVRIAGRTRQEYYQDNKEKISQKDKERYENNKEKISERQKEYYQENKEAIAKKANEKFTCECGGKYTYSHKARHLKSKIHLEFLTKQN